MSLFSQTSATLHMIYKNDVHYMSWYEEIMQFWLLRMVTQKMNSFVFDSYKKQLKWYMNSSSTEKIIL